MKKTVLFIVILFLASTSALTKTTSLPLQCKASGLRYDKDQVVLFAQHTAKPRLYVIHNISHDALWLVHEGDGRGMQAGWDTKLSAHHWSAFLTMDRFFAFNCQVILKNDKIKTVPCQSVLRVCQFSQWYAKQPIGGGYWVSENLPLPKLMHHMRARGFVIQ